MTSPPSSPAPSDSFGSLQGNPRTQVGSRGILVAHTMVAPSQASPGNASQPGASQTQRVGAADEEEEDLWPVSSILAERFVGPRGKKSLQYLLAWQSIDPTTHKVYPPSWEPATSATEALIQHWEHRKVNKADRKRAKKLAARERERVAAVQQGYKKEVKVPKIGGGTPKGKGKGKEKAAVEESDEEDFDPTQVRDRTKRYKRYSSTRVTAAVVTFARSESPESASPPVSPRKQVRERQLQFVVLSSDGETEANDLDDEDDEELEVTRVEEPMEERVPAPPSESLIIPDSESESGELEDVVFEEITDDALFASFVDPSALSQLLEELPKASTSSLDPIIADSLPKALFPVPVPTRSQFAVGLQPSSSQITEDIEDADSPPASPIAMDFDSTLDEQPPKQRIRGRLNFDPSSPPPVPRMADTMPSPTTTTSLSPPSPRHRELPREVEMEGEMETGAVEQVRDLARLLASPVRRVVPVEVVEAIKVRGMHRLMTPPQEVAIAGGGGEARGGSWRGVEMSDSGEGGTGGGSSGGGGGGWVGESNGGRTGGGQGGYAQNVPTTTTSTSNPTNGGSYNNNLPPQQNGSHGHPPPTSHSYAPFVPTVKRTLDSLLNADDDSSSKRARALSPPFAHSLPPITAARRSPSPPPAQPMLRAVSITSRNASPAPSGGPALADLVRASEFISDDGTKEELVRFVGNPAGYLQSEPRPLCRLVHWAFELRKAPGEKTDLVIIDTVTGTVQLKRALGSMAATFDIAKSLGHSPRRVGTPITGTPPVEAIPLIPSPPLVSSMTREALESAYTLLLASHSATLSLLSLAPSSTDLQKLKSEVSDLTLRNRRLLSSKESAAQDFSYMQSQYSEASNAAVLRASESRIAEAEVARLKGLLDQGLKTRDVFAKSIQARLKTELEKITGENRRLKDELRRTEGVRKEASLWQCHLAREKSRETEAAFEAAEARLAAMEAEAVAEAAAAAAEAAKPKVEFKAFEVVKKVEAQNVEVQDVQVQDLEVKEVDIEVAEEDIAVGGEEQRRDDLFGATQAYITIDALDPSSSATHFSQDQDPSSFFTQ